MHEERNGRPLDGVAPFLGSRRLAALPVMPAKVFICLVEQFLIVHPARPLSTLPESFDGVPVGGFTLLISYAVERDLLEGVTIHLWCHSGIVTHLAHAAFPVTFWQSLEHKRQPVKKQ